MLRQTNLSLLRIRMLPVKNRYVSNQTGEFASCPSGNFAGQLFPLLLEIHELHLDQLMGIQCLAHGGNQVLDEPCFPTCTTGFK